ncbi:sigma-54-dependent Fis family transcriptional regulator [Alkalihalophilus pseudofirmus]|uniref:sigma-54 interaction domain-containing protein n=1 Tax=Alkalihalophilus pseudofirmus TaxID=79885 RepID=UPI000953648E|nr:sigma-54-dependent Fis family transcriptional regulator [Alkalihalophilus pseudofirmus]
MEPYEKIRKQLLIYETLINEIDAGIHVIDEFGKTIIYNDKMMEIESLSRKDVIDKDFLDIFKFKDKQGSTLLDALHHQKVSAHKKQTYFTKGGKEITTMNKTFPIYDGKNVIGAMEVAKDVTKLEQLIRRNMEQKGNTRYTFDSIIGGSQAINEVIEHTKRATRTPSSVLIVGETGTGKELFAQSIHNGSDRTQGPFISQNCAAMPDTLIESILFGTSKGAFTGATQKIGLFEQAEGGTLLLDEINSLSPALQAKLLRVIQEKSIRRIGDTTDRKVNVRIISTINEDPIEAIAENRLRKDLYYRLSVVSLFIPALRERKEDIPLLVESFIGKYNHLFRMDVLGVTEQVQEIFQQYDWPGNVRELEHIIEGAMNLMMDEEWIDVSHLPSNLRNKTHLQKVTASVREADGLNVQAEPHHLKDYLHEAERYYINKALEKHKYHKTNAASELGLSRQTLQYRMKRLNIE